MPENVVDGERWETALQGKVRCERIIGNMFGALQIAGFGKSAHSSPLFAQTRNNSLRHWWDNTCLNPHARKSQTLAIDASGVTIRSRLHNLRRKQLTCYHIFRKRRLFQIYRVLNRGRKSLLTPWSRWPHSDQYWTMVERKSWHPGAEPHADLFLFRVGLFEKRQHTPWHRLQLQNHVASTLN